MECRTQTTTGNTQEECVLPGICETPGWPETWNRPYLLDEWAIPILTEPELELIFIE